MRRIQAIDIGTNSVRSVIAEVASDSTYRIIDDEKETTRLGAGLLSTGMLSSESMERTAEALRAFQAIGRNLGVDEVRAIATAAMRTAANGAFFAERLAEELGLDVEIISEEEEGRLVFLSASAHFRLEGASAVVDIGGGSVEVVVSAGAEVEHVISMPLGARILSERFVDEDPISEAAFKRMKRLVRSMLKDRLGNEAMGTRMLVGSGGTVTAIAAMALALEGRRDEGLHGFEVARPIVMQLLAELSRSTAGERRRMPGLAPERVDIILAGALVLAEAMKLTGAPSVFVNARGIREGIVIDTVRRAEHGAVPTREEAVRAFGRRCHYDEAHGTTVAELACQLFDQLAGPLGLDIGHRDLLESAALVHDVGYYISYDRHHRHSYHLILHSGIPGFTNREMRRIAAIARYHTKALPKSKHEAWIALDPGDKAVVEPLAALLRLADGLDRGRAGHVERVRAVLDATSLTLIVHGAGDLHPELFGVEKKKDLFERHFGVPVRVTVAGS